MGGGCLGQSAIVYMSSGMFRGEESSNNPIISISSRLIEFWCFWLPVALGVGGGCMGVGSGWGVPPTHMHMHTHARMCMQAHAHVVNMIISCKWPPRLGEYLGILYDVIHTCMCVHACTCMCMWVGCTLSPPPTPIHPPPNPQGGTHGISQNSIALELIEIFQFRLKI